MTLTHTQQSGYIRLDDVYTDDDGVEEYIDNYRPTQRQLALF